MVGPGGLRGASVTTTPVAPGCREAWGSGPAAASPASSALGPRCARSYVELIPIQNPKAVKLQVTSCAPGSRRPKWDAAEHRERGLDAHGPSTRGGGGAGADACPGADRPGHVALGRAAGHTGPVARGSVTCTVQARAQTGSGFWVSGWTGGGAVECSGIRGGRCPASRTRRKAPDCLL